MQKTKKVRTSLTYEDNVLAAFYVACVAENFSSTYIAKFKVLRRTGYAAQGGCIKRHNAIKQSHTNIKPKNQ